MSVMDFFNILTNRCKETLTNYVMMTCYVNKDMSFWSLKVKKKNSTLNLATKIVIDHISSLDDISSKFFC